MAETRGTFILSEVLLEIKDNNWVPPEKVYLNDVLPDVGYFAGGNWNTPVNVYGTLDRVNYSTDTNGALPGAALSAARAYLAATGSSTAGYFGGGRNISIGGTPTYSIVDKLSYASNTLLQVPGASLSNAREKLSATGNSIAGYFGGGAGPVATMNKTIYSVDTTTILPSANLSTARALLAATGNSIAGYFGGGSSSIVDKLTYSTDTTSALPTAGFFSFARDSLTATGNSTAGYFGGGGGPATTMDKITYSTDTRTTLPGALLSRGAPSATGSSNAGYFGGGFTGGNYVTATTTMDKVTYSTDTSAVLPGAFSSTYRSYHAASSLRANGLPSTPIANTVTGSNFVSKGSSFNTGYFGGGTAGGPNIHSTMDKVSYSTDTRTTLPGSFLTAARSYMGATGNSTAGYFGNGQPPAGGFSSVIDKVTYSTDTTAAVTSASFIFARATIGAAGNSTSGYFSGGYINSPAPFQTLDVTDKLTYSTDTAVYIPTASLSTGRAYVAATGNSTSGYYGGGMLTPGAGVSTIDKISYASDTRTTPTTAALSYPIWLYFAVGNSTSGYFGAGQSSSIVDKISYSTDTRSIAPGAISISITALPGAQTRYCASATGNSTFGYVGGGHPIPSYTTMDKIDYSTDTTIRVPGASLSAPRGAFGATSSTANALPQQDITTTPQAIQGNTGYFGGGSQPGNVYYSTIDKLTYSTDTTAAVPGTGLSVPREYVSSTASFVAGYFGGGLGPGLPGGYTTMDKLTHSSDTAAAVPGAFLTAGPGGNYAMGSAGNSIAGYMAGGTFPGGTRSIVEKITYSTDTTAQAPSATLPNSRYGIGSAGNLTGGYFAGGLTPNGSRSGTDRITYSTDSTGAVPSAFLLTPRNYHTATGNSSAGYFGGGTAGGVSSSIEKITYTTNTTSAVPSAVLSVARDTLAATGNSTAGYFGGGNLPSPVSRYSTIDKLSYSTETRSIAPGGLSVPRQGMGASSSVANAVRGTVPQVPIV